MRSIGQRAVLSLRELGHQAQFYFIAVRSLGEALVRYRAEVVRLIAQMGLGSGALALIGGATVVIGFLTLAGGTVIAIQGYSSLSGIGVEAFSGFISAFVNIRLVAPIVAAIGLAATIGAGATAQLGAMRISEEIDALEVMGIRSIAYLASTRIFAGLIVVVPLFCVAVIMAVFGTRLSITIAYGQSTGVYDHYFRTFLNPVDLLWAFLQALFMAIVIMLLHTYYGFTASGGPVGVGEAVGRATRTSLIVASFITLAVSLAVYGQNGNFNLSG
ncbi:ABC transporter permease [[Mycobacterium] wendilense]|uniref:ABC transporter permease n=2 Tax=[Mycobacterium] wendilense TaxID=3064284 RepID=A0ABM9MIJ9_9MYCO|nr:ABC transporter permease [Mycolicibacterium sp. MU0050]CAJ1586073.1 ABC transporter permease [Mycolicibacterium sp. MU0050]